MTNAILGELTGGKLFALGPLTLSIGIILWPVVFIATDLLNEYFSRDGVRRLAFMTIALIVYAFVVLFAAMQVPVASFSPVTDAQFQAVFGQSLWIIAGSVTAFALSQLVDVGVFWLVRHRTGGRFLWMRATGSTIVSQLIDPSTRAPALAGALAQDFAPRAYWKVPQACPWAPQFRHHRHRLLVAWQGQNLGIPERGGIQLFLYASVMVDRDRFRRLAQTPCGF